MTESLHAPVILDIAGTALTADDRRRLQHPLTGGLILFARHFESRAQLTALCAEAKSLRPDLLIAVDQEGGRVQRFRTDGFTALPAMRSLGELWMDDAMRAIQAATATGLVLALELRACGVDMSFTPVLDLDHHDDTHQSLSGVIGSRSFHRDPRVVSLLGQSLMQGLALAGMASCGKHFPGHGYVAADSHVDVPVDTRSLKAILAEDARPFEWLSLSLSAVMPAHVVYRKVDSRPAGFSRRWLQEILRERLGFAGAVFSDDLGMAGARVIEGRPVGFTEAAMAALDAGCDLVLLCNQSLESGGQAIDELLDGLSQAQSDGRWHPAIDSEARRAALLPQSAPLTWDELMLAPRYLEALARLP
ncbi:beta-N-acetylhexosaminidase [Roseateles depolymerans]|uniref:Beta-hexosaminidase n=1 Tax=Roseateles depolymerans TaxID=76731 RepID=A0A0U3N8G3_9BURK|nr:beta-N-acetylhexosaminidase [Roseateles depolymerans]ALV08459.1 beta-hexosaminidase [Roseateles depolymerans]REG21315.1 beta-N-acetylhexosaminidase [Roseateles depolymerans]